MENQRQGGGFKKSFPKRSFGGAGGGSRPGIKGRFNSGSRGGRSSRSNPGERLDFSRFVNKAIITEEIEKFVPEHAFSDFLVDERLKKAIGHKGYVLPTPIQDRAIPHILKGVDVVGIANTGTGKTATFLIPLINKVLLNKYEKIMVVVPTRELAIQINDELRGFTPTLKVFSTCCVGGMGIGKQIADLKYNPSFVIGTPGRLKDLIERKKIVMSEFNTIVLDEADRMLDMGFINDMKYIMQMMPKDRHTLFFSATLSREIEALINDFLRNPVRISVKTQDTSKNVDQDVVRVSHGQDKLEILHDLLNDKEFSKVLIFGRTKHGVEELSKRLLQKGFRAESIHGNKNHSQRQKALKSFKDNSVQVLVATDVAARGLDISDISHVINYELPETYDDYVHRIGRTGRGSKKGKALTFIGGSAPTKKWK